MQMCELSITAEQYEKLRKLPMHGHISAEDYVEEYIINSAIKCGYGYYGLEKIEPEKITILIGDSCD